MRRTVPQLPPSTFRDLLLAALLACHLASGASASISGTAFLDYDADGVDAGATEPGIEGVLVTVSNAAGEFCQITTDPAGTYIVDTATCNGGSPLNPGAINAFRVELTRPPGSGLEIFEPGAAGGTTVQFVDVSGGPVSGVDVGFNAPNEFCQADPQIATSRFVNAPLPGGPALSTFAESEVTEMPGLDPRGNDLVPPMVQSAAALQSEVGTVWGLAYQRSTASLFSAAFVKFQPGLGASSLPHGPGAIFRTDLGGGGSSLFTTIANVGSHTGAREEVGRVGLGDLEISEDGDVLYTVNLNTRELVTIPISGDPPTPDAHLTTALPLPPASECAAANVHPFALAVLRGKLYVGLICGAPVANLRAYVYELDAGVFTLKINLPFTYPRAATSTFYSPPIASNNVHGWSDWDTYDPVSPPVPFATAFAARSQPWLTDIAFDGGDMILGIRSRLLDTAERAIFAKGGDTLRACADSPTLPTAWTLETAGACGGVAPPVLAVDPWTGSPHVLANNLGPGFGEYYWNDDGWEGESTQGALAQVPGRPFVLVSQIAALGHLNQQGLLRFDHTSGQITGAGNVFFGDDGSEIPSSNGLGDLEALCDPAPIEIGNRVWLDDGDGLQEPGESPIAGATVNLSCDGGTLTASTVTDAEGHYLFGPSNVVGGLVPGQICTVRLDHAADYGVGGPLEGTFPTARDAGSNDLIDSDARGVGGFSQIDVTVGGPGQNDHTFDFGLIAFASADFGDAPDSYDTTAGVDGAVHAITPGYSLGPAVDDEPDGQPTAGADGDDLAGVDDEDGVVFAGGRAGAAICSSGNGLDVTLTDGAAVGSARLDAWVDFNANGAFDHPAEHLFSGSSQPLAVGANALSYNVPCSAFPQDVSFIRFRLTSIGGVMPTGPAVDGEVEDYPFRLFDLDFGDAPAPYPTLLAADGARHEVLLVNNPMLGVLVDGEPDGQASPDHQGDDSLFFDDEEGIFPLVLDLVAGAPAEIEVDTGATGGVLNAWIDFNIDGDWLDAGEQIVVDQALAASTRTVLTVPVPPDAVIGSSSSRFRISSQGGLGPSGLAPDGEVEDYAVEITPGEPILGVSKELVSVVPLGAGGTEFSVSFSITLSNLGNVPLGSLQATTDLALVFADAQSFAVSSLASADLTVDAAFDGAAVTQMLAGIDTLAAGESATLGLDVAVRPGSDAGPYLSSTVGSATGPGGTPLSDLSQDGVDPDPDTNGDPGDNSDPTSVVFELESIAIPTLGGLGAALLAFLLAALGLRLLSHRPDF